MEEAEAAEVQKMRVQMAQISERRRREAEEEKAVKKEREEIEIGDLVCFDGDEDDLLLGLGLVVDKKGDFSDIEEIEEMFRGFEEGDLEYFQLSEIPTDLPMILVLWSRSTHYSSAEEFSLYKDDKTSYSFMWVYPTEIRVLRKGEENG